jgi:molybdate/tungstate transport system permease protein
MSALVDVQAADGLPRARSPALVGAFTLLLIAGPFIALAFATQWSDFHFAPGDTGAIAVSLGYSLIALVLIVAFGTPLAWWLARHSFHGKWVLEAIILLALLTPPLAMGILLTTLFGPYGPVGSLVARTGVELTNSASAFVLAQFYGALPYYVVAARAAFEGVPRELEHISLTLGKSPWQTFWLVSMPLARLGLAAGIALAWVRALGEFGIVLILAYYPQGIPVKLWVNLQDIGLSACTRCCGCFFWWRCRCR